MHRIKCRTCLKFWLLHCLWRMTIYLIALYFTLQSIDIIVLFMSNVVCVWLICSQTFLSPSVYISCVLFCQSCISVSIYFVSVRLLELLLRLGADPNLGDEYTTYYAIAREQRFDPMSGEREKLKFICLPANCSHSLFLL